MSIGEPKHPAPPFILDELTRRETQLQGLGVYPTTRGTEELREAIARWLGRRFGALLDPATQVLPVNGTREALFSFGQAVLSGQPGSIGILPNPFYQIYEGAILMRGATPVYVPASAATDYLPDFARVSDAQWRACELAYICSPANPSGAVLGQQQLRELLELRDRYGFVIAADECYSEIYADETSPPPGLLEVCTNTGRSDFRGCVVFHSLSKRSNLPGLRSGFVAGDADLLAPYYQYRTYHGCAMPVQAQRASTLAWDDESHVVANRALYRAKFAAVIPILAECLEFDTPAAAFYLWPRTQGGTSTPGITPGMSDLEFCARLYADKQITVLPGSFLGRRGSDGINPGANHVRLALVAELAECVTAAERICDWLAGRKLS